MISEISFLFCSLKWKGILGLLSGVFRCCKTSGQFQTSDMRIFYSTYDMEDVAQDNW